MMAVDSAVLVALVTVFSGFAGIVIWFIRQERRLSGFMTRAEHEAICERREERIFCTLTDIKATMDKASDHREKVAAELAKLTTAVAVLTERTSS